MAKKKIAGFQAVQDWLIKEIHRINEAEWSVKRKESAYHRAGNKARELLWIKVADTKPTKDSDKYQEQGDGVVAATTHNRYVTRMRRDLEESGLVHPDFKNRVDALVGEFPKYQSMIESIDFTTSGTIKKSIEAIAKNINATIKRMKSESTKKTAISFLEKLQAVPHQHPCMFSLVRQGDEKANMAKRETDRKTKYQKRPRKFSGIEMINVMNRMLKSDTWDEIMLGLAIATGRRSVEIFHFGQFSKAGNGRIAFTGMRKSKVKADQSFNIPALVDDEIIIEAVERLRSMDRYQTLTKRLNAQKLHEAEYSRKINQSIAAYINETINKVFNGDDENAPRWVFKDSRAIYARLAYAIYCANCKKAGREPQQELNYFKEVLLHTDMNETLSYMQFTLSDADALTSYQLTKAKKEGESLTFADRLPLLVELGQREEIASSKAMRGIHEWVVNHIQANPEAVINGGVIRREYGGSPNRVTEYARLLVELKLDKPNQIVAGDDKKKEKKEPKKVTKTKRVKLTLTFYADVNLEGDDSMTQGEWDDLLDDAAYSSVDDLSMYDYDDLEWDEL